MHTRKLFPDGKLLSAAQHVGVFGGKNWLEEWTFFGAGSDYDTGESADSTEQP